jgi:N-acetylneuraminate synthase
MNPQSWREMVDRTRELEAALGCGVKKIEDNEMQTAILQRRAIRLVRDVPAGEILHKEDLEVLRPAPLDGLAPYLMGDVVGKRLRQAKTRGQHLRINDIE